MRALVTGGAGFIGSNLADALLARGDHVAVLDDLSTGHRANVPEDAELVEADITDAPATTAAMERVRPEVVFHLAAQVDVRRSVADPVRDLAVNGGGTLQVLRAARAAGARHVVYASTGGAIYGDARVIPTPEDAPLRPAAPYGQSKFTGEGYCRLFGELYGLGATALRFANVYGPRQDPLGEGGVIAIFCGRAVHGGDALIFGDGEQTRDFVFVGDLVEACLLAADGAAFGPFNIGTGEETSVNRLVEVLRAAAGAPGFAPDYAPPRPGEVERSCLDVTRARDELGWSARTSLEDGLRRTLQWVLR